MENEIPTEWVLIPVEYGEAHKHLYQPSGSRMPTFFKSEYCALCEAEKRVKDGDGAQFVIARITRMLSRRVEIDTVENDARFVVAQLQPDDDSPGLWIGFETAAQREEAMKLFALAGKP